jgi:hypothetical protein
MCVARQRGESPLRPILRSSGGAVQVLLLAWIAGCSGHAGPAGGSPVGGSGGDPATGGSGGGGTGGVVTGGTGGAIPVPPDASSDAIADAKSAQIPDASTGTPDAAPIVNSNTPMTVPGQPTPSYDGEIPIYYGPEVGPIVQMNCPEDPTVGWTEYKDSFHVEHPYTVPTNTRFSITNGIYNHWVFPPDSPHSPTAMGRNPRTEARYGGLYDKTPGTPGSDGKGNFISGNRMYSADMLIEANAVGSAIMQIHTTATGGGPIGIRINGGNMVNNGSLTVVQGSTVPGGLVDKWFNFKASLNAESLEVKIYVNNCLKSTYKGGRGDGHFYFKNGVYFCKTSTKGCFSHYKNIHLYTK